MDDCLFCKIKNREIPSEVICEDDTIFAFRDIDPKAPHHILVISKEHIRSCVEINPENSAVVAHIFEVIAKFAKMEGFENGFRVVSNIGESAGQSVKHLHFHVLAGRDFSWPPG